MVLAFVINGRTSSSNSKVFDAGFVGSNNLVGVHVQAANNLEVLICMTLKAIGAVQALQHVGADSDGYLSFVVGNHVQVGNAACRSLASSLHARHVFGPVIGNSC